MQATAEFFHFNEKETLLSCPAKQIGSKAKALLALPGFTGKVLAVLSTTIYLRSEGGEILWVSREGLPMHRRCVQGSFRSDSIWTGQSFFTQVPFLRIAGELTIDLDQATEWKPFGVRPKPTEPLTRVNLSVRRLLEMISKFENAKGIGQMIPLISALVNHSEFPNFDQMPLLARARSSILGLGRACSKLDMKEVTQRGKELVGLGPGLTPSGDDFLGGLLFTAHSLKMTYPKDFDWEEEPVAALIDWAHTQTHPISHAILRDHALGHGPEPLHEVVASLLNGEDLDRTMKGVRRLLGIGDTSGWDILAGMLTGMLLIAGIVLRREGGKE
jgi:hypothetical protein